MSPEQRTQQFKSICTSLMEHYSPKVIAYAFLNGETSKTRANKISDLLNGRRNVTKNGMVAIQFLSYYHENLGDLSELKFDESGTIQWPAKPVPITKRKHALVH